MKKKYLCHVDFFGLYNLYSEKFQNKKLIDVFNEILKELKVDTIYIATFNYDFLEIGRTKYGAISQLNEITRLIQKQKNFKHTFDPVFSFCTNDKEYNFKVKKKFESFGKESLYNYALKENMEYLNLGTNQNFISTAIHYAEKFFDVKYRYKKQFVGNYKYKNQNNKIIYNHTVWPMTKKFCNYDAKKINKDLLKNGIWNVIKLKNGFYIKKANIKKFNDYIIKRVKNDPFYPVHKKTKIWMKKFIKNKKDISIENFEE
tara:strand:- start:21920 stop:22696 length:777 start_codon:yes stop_codon:yes gene_type:complete